MRGAKAALEMLMARDLPETRRVPRAAHITSGGRFIQNQSLHRTEHTVPLSKVGYYPSYSVLQL